VAIEQDKDSKTWELLKGHVTTIQSQMTRKKKEPLGEIVPISGYIKITCDDGITRSIPNRVTDFELEEVAGK